MNVETHVVSLKLSKKLHEIGVKQESYFYWHNVDSFPQVVSQTSRTERSGDFLVSAFLASELMQLLPNSIFIPDKETFGNFRLNICKFILIKNAWDLLDREKHPKPVLLQEIHEVICYGVSYYCDSTEMEGVNYWLRRVLFENVRDEIFQNSLARCLIYLYENGYIKND